MLVQSNLGFTKNGEPVKHKKRSNKLVILAGLALLVVFMALTRNPARASSTITVTSKADTQADDGVCTLREAITAANNDTASGASPGECIAGSGSDTINFAITGSSDFTNNSADGYTITLASDLPAISEAVTINGYSQPGAVANTAPSPQPLNSTLLVQVSGSAADSISINTSNVTVSGLILTSFNAANGALVVSSGTNNVISGNYIGVNPSGSAAAANLGGLSIGIGAEANVGGTNPADRNIISGNTYTQLVVLGKAVVQGNYVGPLKDGSLGPAATFGIGLYSNDNLVGGMDATATNVVAGNQSGIAVVATVLGVPVGNSILNNMIYSNSFAAIDLVADTDFDFIPDADLGLNTNDVGDGDAGSNHYLNSAVITSASYVGSAVSVQFDLDVADSVSGLYKVEFFANDSASENGGKTYLGYVNTTAGTHSSSGVLAAPNGYDLAGKYITSTVTQITDEGNLVFGSTSEFSTPFLLTLGQDSGANVGASTSASSTLADTGAGTELWLFGSVALLGASLYLTLTSVGKKQYSSVE